MASTKSAIPLFIFLAILLLLLPCAAVQYTWYRRMCRRTMLRKSRIEATNFSTSIELENMRPLPSAVPPLPARSASRVKPLPLVFRGADGKFIVSGTVAQTSTTNIDQGQTTTSSDVQIRKPELGKSQVQTRITNDGHVQTTITYNGEVVVQKRTANAEDASSGSDMPSSVESGAQDSRQPIGMQHATFAEAKPFTLQPAPVPRRKKKTATVVLDVPEQKPSFEAAPRVKSHVAKPEDAVMFVPEDLDDGFDTEAQAQVPKGWI